MLVTILLFVVVLSLLVFVHELGHFLCARVFGMKVEEFGFGFPPRLWGVKRGGTMYSINWIPLGGFVKMKGEGSEDRQDLDSFAGKPAWQRFLVLVAGVAMNVVFAAVLISGAFMIGAPSIIDEGLPAAARISGREVRILSVVSDSPAARAGVQVGDRLLSIDGQGFETADAAHRYIADHASVGIEAIFQHEDGASIQPRLVSEDLPSVGTKAVGVGIVTTGLVSYPFPLAIGHGVVTSLRMTGDIASAFGQMLWNLVTARQLTADLSGPVGIAVMTGQAAALGAVHLMQFAALLSLNLAVINVIPFPALDGGRVLFILIEKVRRRAVDQRLENVAHSLGFVLLMMLVILVTYRDVVRYGGQIWGSIRSLVGA